MSQLVYLKQKIRSIQTTKKITHAVRLVSMSLYNRVDKINNPLNTYTNNVQQLFGDVLTYVPEWRDSLLFPRDVLDTRPLFIVVATSKGLCGSLNSNLLRYIDTSLFIEKQQTPKFIAIGQKAVTYVREKNLGELIHSYPELNSNNFVALADELIDKIINAEPNYSSVSFFSSVAKSFFAQMPRKFTVIPMQQQFASMFKDKDLEKEQGSESLAEKEREELDELIWEQSKDDILKFLSISYLRSSIIYILFHALRAEHSARFLAMENSTNNAEKYLERLTLQFNKLRQSLITKEVSELSASFPTR